ncbi:oligopeptide ABC transporter permease [Bacillus horti]|uniref:Peptide/nickel transport system permease protein n=1 Tax=Caldalkalibacillus horti TaxID=77523 RepID=A0ABT9W536_9BACI|nr:oligopeptide ABC transporter permease [Bacillus horti]MDQ0168245.1 peptide/nickel transport system permease protein [Bacillus horti]
MTNNMANIEEPKKIQERKEKPRSIWSEGFARLFRNKLAVVGILIVVFMFVFSFIGPYFSEYKDARLSVQDQNKPPDADHWLGTDKLGRDILLRLMEAGQVSLLVGVVATSIIILIGVTVGLLAGYYGKWVDTLLMRLADVIYSVPTLPILILLGAVLSDLKFPPDKRIYLVMFIIGIISWMTMSRMIRSQILSLKEQEFMLANEVLGLRDRKKIFKHLLPNTLPIIIVAGTLGVASTILLESALSFLGLGVVPPTPSWGEMISAANNMIDFQRRPWLWVPPGVCILVTVVAINLIGDGLRDAFDPKQKR